MHKELGKIGNFVVGKGGYQDAMIGYWITFEGKGWGVCHGKGEWQGQPSKDAKWTMASKSETLATLFLEIEGFLRDAKVNDTRKLIGIPIEVTFDSPFGKLIDWRILTEVL